VGTSTLNDGLAFGAAGRSLAEALLFDLPLQHMSGQNARQSTEHIGGHISAMESSLLGLIGFVLRAAAVSVIGADSIAVPANAKPGMVAL